MALEYPYVEQTVIDGVTDVLATQHNHQEGQITELTDIAYRHDNQKCVAVLPGEINPGGVVDVLTLTVLNVATTLRFTMGATALTALTTPNIAGPVGTGVPTFIQRFTCPTAVLMGALPGSGQKTSVRITFFEDTKPVGWIDAIVVIP